MPDTLQFWLGTSSTLAKVGLLSKISSASLNLQLNNAGSVSLVVDRSENVINSFAPLSTCILIYRSGFLVWSGPVWTMQESYSGEQKKINITAIGWFELLNHRLIRSLPGYLLQTSAITFTNATFESAISGWTGSFYVTTPQVGSSSGTANTATRDTVVFHGGAGSFLWSEGMTGPFGSLVAIGTATAQQLIQATPLSGSVVSGRRYKLNFWARGRRSPSGVGAKLPELRIIESGSTVASLALDLCNDLTYNTYFDGSSFINPTTIANAGTVTGSFAQYSIEWVSAGNTPTFQFYWLINPTQLASLYTNWVGSATVTRDVFGDAAFNTPTTSLSSGNGAWTGTFESGRVYRVSVTYMLGVGTNVTSGGFQIRDLVTGILGSVALGAGTGSWLTTTFTFTAPAGQIYFLANMVLNSTGDVLQIRDISIQENATNTDPLINIDDVTLQEYIGDGIYSNMDAGAIASALLQKTNADNNSNISPGTVQTTQTRTRTYQQFSNVGKEIKALSDIEAGYDFAVDPVTKALNIYNRTTSANFPVAAAGSNAGSAGTWTYSANRTASLRFEYGVGSDNLVSVKKMQDGSSVVNRLNVKGKYALGQATDATSLSTYGLFEDLVSLPDVIDASTSVLPFYANAEIAFRKNPRVLYEIETKTGGTTPRLFIDFNIGDRAMLNVGPNILVGNAALAQAIRIFGVQLSVDAEGNEHLSGLQLSL